MRINTKLGALVAEAVYGHEYPGMYVSLERGHQTYGIVLLEVDQSDKQKPPRLRVHVWDPADIFGGPTFTEAFDGDAVNSMFEEDNA